MHRMRAAQGGGAHLGEADSANLAGRLEFRQRSNGVFDGNSLVPTMQIVQVDALGAEIAQRLLADRTDRLWPAVDHAFAIAAEQAAFAGDDDVVRPPRENFADELLVSTKSVQRRGIEMR